MGFRAFITALLLCVAAETSRAAPTSIVDGAFELPAGYTKTDGGIVADKLEAMRTTDATGTTDARVYVSRDEAVVLLAMGMVNRDGMVSSLGEMATVDRLMTEALAGKNAGKVITSSQRREGAMLVSDVKYTINGRSEVFHNLACVDSKHMLHMVSLLCVGPDDQLDGCLAAQHSLKLVVPDAMSFLDEPAAAAVPRVSGKPWSFVIPAGYTEAVERTRQGQEKLRAGDFHVYETSTHLRRIVVMGVVAQLDEPPTWGVLEQLENTAVTGAEAQATSHVARSMQRNGNLLVGTQAEVLADDVRRYDRRLYGVDARNQVYAFSIFCMGLGMESAECANVTDTMRLDIPLQVTPAEVGGARLPDPGRGGWKYLLAAIGLFAAAAIAFRIRRGHRRRRHLH